MTILNLMLGRERGGIEQAAVDYAEAMTLASIPNLTVITPHAWAEAPLVAARLPYQTLRHRGGWDIFASYRLYQLAKRSKATAIICHGNRALSLALRAAGGRIPIIAVAHNYKTRRFARADRCLAITQHLADHLAAAGAKNIALMPNMVRAAAHTMREPFRTPPIIGSMGRLVEKKGFIHFIEALSILHTRGVSFRAVLGGEGEEAANLDAAITHYRLGDVVKRIGWVEDKNSFFQSLDIFVLPSLHEPFGIVLIEAMSHGVPVISTDSEGPSEILHHGIDGLLVRKKDPEALADAIQELLLNPARAQSIGAAGTAYVASEYSMQAMAKRLKALLSQPS